MGALILFMILKQVVRRTLTNQGLLPCCLNPKQIESQQCNERAKFSIRVKTQHAPVLRSVTQKSIDNCLKFLERLFWTWRGLQASATVDEKNRWVTGDVPVKVGDFPF